MQAMSTCSATLARVCIQACSLQRILRIKTTNLWGVACQSLCCWEVLWSQCFPFVFHPAVHRLASTPSWSHGRRAFAAGMGNVVKFEVNGHCTGIFDLKLHWYLANGFQWSMKTMDFVNLTRFWSVPLRCWRFPRTRCEGARLLQLQVIYCMSCHTGPPPSGDDRLYQPTSQIFLQDANNIQYLHHLFVHHLHMGDSKNSGTPKWMVYNGKPINIDDLGVSLFSETPIYLLASLFCLFGLSKSSVSQQSFVLFAKLGISWGDKRILSCFEQVSSCFDIVGGSRKYHDIPWHLRVSIV